MSHARALGRVCANQEVWYDGRTVVQSTLSSSLFPKGSVAAGTTITDTLQSCEREAFARISASLTNADGAFLKLLAAVELNRGNDMRS